MNSNTPAAPVAPPEHVQRFAVIIRDRNGKGELLGQLHASEPCAVATAAYWQAHYREDVTAETVAFNVPTRGAPVKITRDLLP